MGPHEQTKKAVDDDEWTRDAAPTTKLRRRYGTNRNATRSSPVATGTNRSTESRNEFTDRFGHSQLREIAADRQSYFSTRTRCGSTPSSPSQPCTSSTIAGGPQMYARLGGCPATASAIMRWSIRRWCVARTSLESRVNVCTTSNHGYRSARLAKSRW